MASTYEPIASTTLGSASSSLSLSSLPSTFTDLRFVIRGYASTGVGTHFRLNGDTGSNYSLTNVGGYTSTYSGRQSNYARGDLYWYSYWPSSGAPAILIVDLMSYANTNIFKTALTQYSLPGTETTRSVHLWRSTAAVNEFTLFTFSSTLGAGTSIDLYGIKAA